MFYLNLASVFTRAYSRRCDDGIHLFLSARAKLCPPKPNMAEKPKRTNWPRDEKLHMSTSCRWPVDRHRDAKGWGKISINWDHWKNTHTHTNTVSERTTGANWYSWEAPLRIQKEVRIVSVCVCVLTCVNISGICDQSLAVIAPVRPVSGGAAVQFYHHSWQT